jgi:hypothetical protein
MKILENWLGNARKKARKLSKEGGSFNAAPITKIAKKPVAVPAPRRHAATPTGAQPAVCLLAEWQRTLILWRDPSPLSSGAANRKGCPPPTLAQHARAALGRGRVSLLTVSDTRHRPTPSGGPDLTPGPWPAQKAKGGRGRGGKKGGGRGRSKARSPLVQKTEEQLFILNSWAAARPPPPSPPRRLARGRRRHHREGVRPRVSTACDAACGEGGLVAGRAEG